MISVEKILKDNVSDDEGMTTVSVVPALGIMIIFEDFMLLESAKNLHLASIIELQHLDRTDELELDLSLKLAS